ncbi:MAG TPA: hypothetical protein VM659_05915 [Dongiaceae bacterium]|nr:hypothetical protein [Dongiaceae bacterium]
MGKSARRALMGLLIILAIGLGLVMIGLHQLADPASWASEKFTARVVEQCIAASRHEDQSQPADAENPADNAADICRCGADDLREDLADTGIGGLAHILFVEGVDAKMQRVMDGCQASPSAP